MTRRDKEVGDRPRKYVPGQAAAAQALRRQGSHEDLVRSSLREACFVEDGMRVGTIHHEVGRAV